MLDPDLAGGRTVMILSLGPRQFRGRIASKARRRWMILRKRRVMTPQERAVGRRQDSPRPGVDR